MNLHNSLWLFLSIHAIGLAVWLTVSVINNSRAFGGSTAAAGATMSMAPLKQPLAIDAPLLSRAIGSHAFHRVALLVVLALQAMAAVACWAGCWQLLVVGEQGAALAELGPECLHCLPLRHASWRAVVRLLDPAGGPAVDPYRPAGLGGHGFLPFQYDSAMRGSRTVTCSGRPARVRASAGMMTFITAIPALPRRVPKTSSVWPKRRSGTSSTQQE